MSQERRQSQVRPAEVPVAVAVEATKPSKGTTININISTKGQSRKSSVSPSAGGSASSKNGPASTRLSKAERKASMMPVATVEDLGPELDIDEAADIDQNIDEAAIKKYLNDHHFPPGLIDIVTQSCIRAGPRYYVVDDSGSMDTGDGQRVMYSDAKVGEAHHLHCSRWEELGESLRFHAGLIHASNMQAAFRFLNGPRMAMPFDGQKGLDKINSVLDDPPSGTTPLCKHMKEIVDEIEHNAPALRQHRRKAIICIFTDGSASDGELISVLAKLVDLPVWLVVRLSTNEKEVVDYWNSLDARLEVDMDILDDPLAEAVEVHKNNPWLSYNHYLHRMREFGVTMREVDQLDEAPLSPVQLRRFIARIFNKPMELLPDPGTDMPLFIKYVDEQQKKLETSVVHDLFHKRPEPWVHIAALKSHIKAWGKVKSSSFCALL